MKSLIAVWLLLLALLLIGGCDPLMTVTFVNETSEELQFYDQASPPSILGGFEPIGPGSSFRYGLIPAGFTWLRIAATREDGQWIFDHAYTRDELEKAKMRVVVSSLEPIAPPMGVKVVPYPGAPLPVLPTVRPSEDPASTPTPVQRRPSP